jgi:hypothetical protein
MGKGNLVQTPFSEINSTLELLDRYDVTPRDFGALRSASSWIRATTARIIKADPVLWALLSVESRASGLGFAERDYKGMATNDEKLTAILGILRGTHEAKAIEHMIDLSVPCKLPFNGAERLSPAKSGVMKLELKDDDLYLDGKKIELVLSERQQGNKRIVGHELRVERKKLGGNISAKILDYLEEHPELWPEKWKKDADGNTIYVFFWDDIFRDPADGNLFVRYGYWSGGRVVSDYYWLDDVWRRRRPAASFAK